MTDKFLKREKYEIKGGKANPQKPVKIKTNATESKHNSLVFLN